MGQSSINGPFSMAMLNNQRVSNHSVLLDRFFVHPGQATGDLSRRPGATAQPFEA